MDTYKLFDAIDPDDLYDLALAAEKKLDRKYFRSLEANVSDLARQNDFIDYLIDELTRYFRDKVEFEPIALHYVEKHWDKHYRDREREYENENH